MSFPVVIHDTSGGAHFNPNATGAGSTGNTVDSLAHGRWPWGTKMVYPDGRCFRYAQKSNAASVAGDLQQSVAAVANHIGLAVQTAVVAGDRAISVTLGATAVTVNQYEGGYLVMEGVSGHGYTYAIGPHPADAGGGTFSVPLAGGNAAQVAATTSGVVSLIANPYRGVVIFPTTPLAQVAGVSPRIIGASLGGWLQTHGTCAVFTTGTTTLDGMAVPSTNTAGSIMPSAASTSPQVGIVQRVAAAGSLSTVFLTIDG